MPLSVLSALARLDVDPWQEAAKLARLPGKAATEALASLIAALPDRPAGNLEPGTIAARLIALLPRQVRSNVPSRETLLGAGAAANPRHIVRVILINAIVMALMLGAQWIVASRQTPAQMDDTHAPASSTVSPQTQPPNANQ